MWMLEGWKLAGKVVLLGALTAVPACAGEGGGEESEDLEESACVDGDCELDEAPAYEAQKSPALCVTPRCKECEENGWNCEPVEPIPVECDPLTGICVPIE